MGRFEDRGLVDEGVVFNLIGQDRRFGKLHRFAKLIDGEVRHTDMLGEALFANLIQGTQRFVQGNILARPVEENEIGIVRAKL